MRRKTTITIDNQMYRILRDETYRRGWRGISETIRNILDEWLATKRIDPKPIDGRDDLKDETIKIDDLL